MNKYTVYHGEYTLNHWIKLLLNKEIELPNYQRSFVWAEENTKSLIKSFQEEMFVPPVIIGAYQYEGIWHNYILDGQQRLTSILLCYLNIFPKKDNFPPLSIPKLADDNDDAPEEEENTFLEWNINTLLKKKIGKLHSCEELKTILFANGEENSYSTLFKDARPNPAFFEHTFLGFSFITPNKLAESMREEQTKYFAKLFRSINTSGRVLNNQESRRALYWLKEDLAGYFEPEWNKNLLISKGQVDMVRYLALLSERAKLNLHHETKPVAQGFGSKTCPKSMEAYLVSYIYHIVNEENGRFLSLKEMGETTKIFSRLNTVNSLIEELNIPSPFPSIIDADYWLFGLIYYTLFKPENLKRIDKTALADKIKHEIEISKQDEKEKKRPSALKYINKRLNASLTIYQEAIESAYEK